MLIGAITPPVGSMLFVSCSIAEISIEKSVRILIPFILILVVVAVAVLFIPFLSTGISSFAYK
jgi:TRAP-type C4-dicarboxylate transport system permease large subunit